MTATTLTIEEYAEQREQDALHNADAAEDDSYAYTRYRSEARAYRDILLFLDGHTYRQEYLDAVADRIARRKGQL